MGGQRGWLIETWDVLKPMSDIWHFNRQQINRNMRCIETGKFFERIFGRSGLIETWDVLKRKAAGTAGRWRLD